MYPRGIKPDRQMEMFTKAKEHLILNTQGEFLNGSHITKSIRKGDIFDLSKKIPIKRISTEDKPIRAESENDPFKEMWNIQIENHVGRKNWNR